MKTSWIRPTVYAALAVVVLGGGFLMLRSAPIPVDTAIIKSQPLEVTVDEEGKTRIREIYVVSTPVAGKVLRSPLELGDDVSANQTVVAVIQPRAPAFLDARARAELGAEIAAASAAVELHEAEVASARSELEFAQADLRRAEKLYERRIASERAIEKARLDAVMLRSALTKAQANLIVRQRQLETARARLIGPEMAADSPSDQQDCCIRLTAPVNGRVLKIAHESEQVVTSGAALLEIGDPQDLEIVVELLSSDAFKLKVGAKVMIDGYGGAEALDAKLRRIDPAGFTKVSALGIEEQKVNVVLDPVGKSAVWQRIGHDFRVFVRISVWRSDAVLAVPLSALFRDGERWSVFRMIDGTAQLTGVEIGHRNTEFAELSKGLSVGDRVVLHPSDRITDGVEITEREENS